VTAVRTVVEHGHQCTVHDVPTAAQIGVLASHHALRYDLIAQRNQYQRDAVPFGVALKRFYSTPVSTRSFISDVA